MTDRDWQPGPQPPNWTGIDLLPREAFAFQPGQDLLHVPTGTAVHVLAVDHAAGEPRPYIVAGDPDHAEQHRAAATDLEPLTRRGLQRQIRQHLRAVVTGRPAEAAQAAAQARLAALQATLRGLAPGA